MSVLKNRERPFLRRGGRELWTPRGRGSQHGGWHRRHRVFLCVEEEPGGGIVKVDVDRCAASWNKEFIRCRSWAVTHLLGGAGLSVVMRGNRDGGREGRIRGISGYQSTIQVSPTPSDPITTIAPTSLNRIDSGDQSCLIFVSLTRLVVKKRASAPPTSAMGLTVRSRGKKWEQQKNLVRDIGARWEGSLANHPPHPTIPTHKLGQMPPFQSWLAPLLESWLQ